MPTVPKSSFVLGLCAGAAFLIASVAAARPARANGAFPDSLQILVPAAEPHRIILATNFGLIISDDDGATWEWTCEARAKDNTILYQQAATPSNRLYAV